MSDDARRERWEKRGEWPLTIAALVFLVAYAWPILRPSIDPVWLTVTEVLSWVAWAMFAIDYVVRLGLSTHRVTFVRKNLLDLAVVLLPLLRPLRLLRLVTLLAVLNRKAGGSLRGRVGVYVGGAAVMIIFVASLAVLDAERGASGSNINGFGTALWWAIVTVTTVGYGDHYPVTTEGRVVATGLMMSGIAIIGVVTATFASWLIDRVREIEDEAAEQAPSKRDVLRLTAEVSELREAVERLRPPG